MVDTSVFIKVVKYLGRNSVPTYDISRVENGEDSGKRTGGGKLDYGKVSSLGLYLSEGSTLEFGISSTLHVVCNLT